MPSVSAWVTDAMFEMIERRRAEEGKNRSRYVHSLIVKGIEYELERLAAYDRRQRRVIMIYYICVQIIVEEDLLHFLLLLIFLLHPFLLFSYIALLLVFFYLLT